jgi:hypothetical protein
MHNVTVSGNSIEREELITPENLSKELLKTVFDAAFMDTSFDEDGDLRVKEDVSCWVFPSGKGRDRIKLLTNYGFKPETNTFQRLTFVNEINREYVVVRACMNERGSLSFSYDILVSGGLTKQALILAVKRFCGIPPLAIEELNTDDIVI